MRRRLLTIALLLQLVGPAAADTDRDRARALAAEAIRHYALSEYEQALEQFRELYRLTGLPDFLYNMAQCHRILGDLQEAVRKYNAYLDAAPEAPNREEVEHHIDHCYAELARRAAWRPPTSPHPAPSSASSPPPPVSATAAPSPSVAPLHMPAPTVRHAPTKSHWWLWTLGAAAVAGGVTAVLLTIVPHNAPLPATDYGPIRF